ncbi:MAG TPA: ATP-dependent helicase [Candidatus Onthocola gallistercoris]|uniref:DNA 3'-5' helicase n=1 Tax=Candidatus Onthocola gallistercoris TaxID=2840876 RepID=A0A9D1HEH2_9FIRM|nr:ATP-dependent helicase [Candidatus Onthocola gallistercoris]
MSSGKKALTEAQEKAVTHVDGPMMVLAGPGSGKTLVITERTRYLVEKAQVSPGNILVVTFTKAAAQEMRRRFDSLMGGRRLPVSFGTFHAIFFTILKYAYHYTVGHILREDQKIQILRDIIQHIDVEMDDSGDFITDIAGEISFVKGDGISLEHYYAKNCSDEVFRSIFREYERRLSALHRIDFDDMLVKTYRLFKERPDILAAWQKKYQYILIDEFQDINRMQFEIIKMLALPENNLFIVGDDDQSIYRFRGAKPEILLNFQAEYPDCQQVVLDVNFRCAGPIIKSAGRVIRNNTMRFPKNIRGAAFGEGKKPEKEVPVVIKSFGAPREEYIQICREILELHKNGLAWEDMAVIFRTNHQFGGLIEKLMAYNIPFTMKDSVPNIYKHWIAKDIFAYVRLAQGSKARKDYLRVINRPNRFISRSFFDSGEISLDDLKEMLSEREWMAERVEQLEYDLYMISQMAPYPALNYIRHAVGYEAFLKDHALEHRTKPEEWYDIYDELLEKSRNYEDWKSFNEGIRKYTELLSMKAVKNWQEGKGIRLMTMHGAKGLEYSAVYIPDACEGVTPHKKAVLEADLEEERRMFYVAMTRAKDRLRIYTVKERFGHTMSLSRFVEELMDRH